MLRRKLMNSISLIKQYKRLSISETAKYAERTTYFRRNPDLVYNWV